MAQDQSFAERRSWNQRRLAVCWLVIVGVLSPISGLRAGDGDLEFVQLYELQLKDNYSTGFAYSVAFSPDGKTALLGTDSRVTGVVLLDALTGQEIRRFPSGRFPNLFLFVDYSPDGRHGAVGCLNGKITIWSMPEGQEVHSLVHGGVPSSIQFSPDARRLASVGTDGTLCIWDVAGGTEIARMKANAIPITDVDWSPDGRQIATVGWDRTLRVWDVATETVARATPHPDALWSVDYSPDGQQIATVTGGMLEGVPTDENYALSDDNIVRIWDSNTGQLLKELEGLGHAARCIAYSPDGELLAAASVDKAVHVWDVTSGEEVGRIDCKSWMHAVAWSPDGKSLAAAGGVSRGKEPLNIVDPERLRVFRVNRPGEKNETP